MSTTQLIELYCAVCQHYSNTLGYDVQRLSNNSQPTFLDEEIITIYLWGIYNGHYEQKAVYRFIYNYYHEWFPKLPSYTNFSRRLNNLAPCFIGLTEILLNIGEWRFSEFQPRQVIDSLPIVVAKQSRSSFASVAPEMCSKGYCATKKEYYYGVKLHLRACLRPKTIPFPSQLAITKAQDNDLTVGKQMLQNQCGFTLYADKAYKDRNWESDLIQNNLIIVVTPPKKAKGQKSLSFSDNQLSMAISRIRQPIESLFSWLISKTHIQEASKVRSANGLIVHIFAKLALCLLLLLRT
jgi:hypothetical protein